jgi:hypothetical protein
MSWWNLPGRQDDVIGDRPADIIADALGRVAVLRENTTQPAPALPELMGALGRAIEQTASELEDPATAGGRVVAFTSTGEIEPSPGGDDLVAPLADGIRKVAAAYRERFERNPRLVELLAVFAFVLRPDHPELHDLGIR